MKIKINVNKYDLIKLKRFFMAVETINKSKRQPTEWDKIFPNNAIDKRLISKIYKQLNIFLKRQRTLSKKGK